MEDTSKKSFRESIKVKPSKNPRIVRWKKGSNDFLCTDKHKNEKSLVSEEYTDQIYYDESLEKQ